MSSSKWKDETFIRNYNACAKRKERGQLPEYYDCLKHANMLFQKAQRKQKEQLRKNLEDGAFRTLYSMIQIDKKGEIQAQRLEQPVNVDRVHIKLRKRKPDNSVNIW